MFWRGGSEGGIRGLSVNNELSGGLQWKIKTHSESKRLDPSYHKKESESI